VDTAAPAPTATLAAAPAVPQFDIALMQRMVERLSSDELEGRAPSSGGPNPKVLDTIIAEFKAAGPAARQPGQWLQPVPTWRSPPRSQPR
jgi:hypothetical protein